MESFIKIKLFKDAIRMNEIEFEVFAERMTKHDDSKTMTLNWEFSGFQNEGLFYTDSNEY